jgi:NADH dehydrogenase [ubiquinone] 1 alpha subcomplex assembly factor 7
MIHCLNHADKLSYFQAFKGHKIADVFHRPGECDLTTNVDFAFLQEAMGDLGMSIQYSKGPRSKLKPLVTTHGPIPQSAFLESMGLRLRLSRLLENAATDERRAAIQGAANRLVDPTGMGTQYQVMGITSETGGEVKQTVWPFVQTETPS